MGDVPDVCPAGPHIGAVHAGEGAGKLPFHRLDGVFRRGMTAPDGGEDLLHQGGVLQQHGVDGEDGGGLSAKLCTGGVVQGGQLKDGLTLGCVEAVGLLLRGEPGFRLRMEGPAPVEAQGAKCELVQDRFSGQDLHRITAFACPGECLAGCGWLPDVRSTRFIGNKMVCFDYSVNLLFCKRGIVYNIDCNYLVIIMRGKWIL